MYYYSKYLYALILLQYQWCHPVYGKANLELQMFCPIKYTLKKEDGYR